MCVTVCVSVCVVCVTGSECVCYAESEVVGQAISHPVIHAHYSWSTACLLVLLGFKKIITILSPGMCCSWGRGGGDGGSKGQNKSD